MFIDHLAGNKVVQWHERFAYTPVTLDIGERVWFKTYWIGHIVAEHPGHPEDNIMVLENAYKLSHSEYIEHKLMDTLEDFNVTVNNYRR